MSAETLPAVPALPDADLARLFTTTGPVRTIRPGGRPAEYSEELVHSVLIGVADGHSLKAVCLERGIPYMTVQAWKRHDPTFAAALARARMESADSLVDQNMDIVDDESIMESNEALGRAKMRVEYRKWLASKYSPKVYGDKLDVQGDLTINITAKRYTPEVIDVEPEKPA